MSKIYIHDGKQRFTFFLFVFFLGLSGCERCDQDPAAQEGSAPSSDSPAAKEASAAHQQGGEQFQLGPDSSQDTGTNQGAEGTLLASSASLPSTTEEEAEAHVLEIMKQRFDEFYLVLQETQAWQEMQKSPEKMRALLHDLGDVGREKVAQTVQDLMYPAAGMGLVISGAMTALIANTPAMRAHPTEFTLAAFALVIAGSAMASDNLYYLLGWVVPLFLGVRPFQKFISAEQGGTHVLPRPNPVGVDR